VPSRGTVLLGRPEQPTFGLEDVPWNSKAALVQQSNCALSVDITCGRVRHGIFENKTVVGAFECMEDWLWVVRC
jgi:hypothetical protein